MCTATMLVYHIVTYVQIQSSSCNGVRMWEGFLCFPLAINKLPSETLYSWFLTLGVHSKVRPVVLPQKWEKLNWLCPGNTCNNANIQLIRKFFSLCTIICVHSCVFQVILCYRVRKWRRSDVSHAETEKTARRACQVCISEQVDFWHSAVVQIMVVN